MPMATRTPEHDCRSDSARWRWHRPTRARRGAKLLVEDEKKKKTAASKIIRTKREMGEEAILAGGFFIVKFRTIHY